MNWQFLDLHAPCTLDARDVDLGLLHDFFGFCNFVKQRYTIFGKLKIRIE